MKSARLIAAVLCSVALLGASAGAASAAPSPLEAAREALRLSNSRLELMDEVMASKWFSRAPIQDTAQEESVKDAAVVKAQALGVAAGGTRAIFTVEIVAAKEVQLGWGSHWLYYGAPPTLAAPELTQLRAELSEISERIVAVLPRLVSLSKLPDAQGRVEAMAEKILTVKYLSTEGRAAIADALLGVRRARPRVLSARRGLVDAAGCTWV